MHEGGNVLQKAQVLDQAGRGVEALVLLRGFVRESPENAEAWAQLADLQMRNGEFSDAAECFRQVVRLRPEDLLSQNRFAIALARHGKLEEAIAQLRALTTAHPTDAAAHHNLGVALAERKELLEAVGCFRRALDLSPGYLEAHHQLANALRGLTQHAEAEAAYRRAMTLAPHDASVLHDLGTLLTETRRPGAAEAILRQACRLKPDWVDAHNNLGLALLADGQFEAALQSFDRALRIEPRYASAHANLGTVFASMGRIPQSLSEYEIALAIEPEAVSTHWNRALALLKAGDYARGWPEYEWRWNRAASPPRQLPRPMWDGSDLAGRTILLYGEQGLGDTLQFVRYATLIKARGARKVTLECPWPIAQLVRTCPGVDELVVEGSPLPEFDVHLPLLSAPSRFGTTLMTVPNQVPYLHPDPSHVAHWGNVLHEQGCGHMRVGLYWQGNPHFQLDRFRGVKLEMFRPLAEIPGVRLFTLQRGPGCEQLDRWAAPLDIRELTGREIMTPHDWVDTAAIMKNLDLVVTTCTAAAHLAGAVAVPTWVLVSASPDWRWMLERTDSPWYPTSRLFRQERLGEWEPVMQRVAHGLTQLTRRRGATTHAQHSIRDGDAVSKSGAHFLHENPRIDG